MPMPRKSSRCGRRDNRPVAEDAIHVFGDDDVEQLLRRAHHGDEAGPSKRRIQTTARSSKTVVTVMPSRTQTIAAERDLVVDRFVRSAGRRKSGRRWRRGSWRGLSRGAAWGGVFLPRDLGLMMESGVAAWQAL